MCVEMAECNPLYACTFNAKLLEKRQYVVIWTYVHNLFIEYLKRAANNVV